MHRLAPVLGPIAVAITALTVLSGCSSSKKSETPTTPPTSTSTTVVAASTTTEAAPSTSSTAPIPVATTTTNAASVTTAAGGGPRITGFTISPASPVQCNAPTMIQLQWTSTGAKSVALSIDGKLFAAYGGGPQNHLEPLACDGQSHAYLLTALGNGQKASAQKVVRTEKTS